MGARGRVLCGSGRVLMEVVVVVGIFGEGRQRPVVGPPPFDLMR
jgi:hypothetical protein